jgi:DHA1 family tetracycline resistance protein-like MFS transporter
MLPIFLIVLVDVFGMTLVLPLLAIYAEKFGASALVATMLVSVYAGCQLVSGPFLGQVSDRTGRKPMLLVSQVGTFIGFIILARATALWMIFLSRVIDGFTAGNLSLAQAYISDNTEPKNRAKSFALIGIAFGVGFFIGPSLTGYLAGKFSLSAPIYVAAGMSALSILCTATLLRGGRPHHARPVEGPGGRRISIINWKAYGDYFSRPVLRSLLLEMFCFLFSFSLFTSGFALFAERRFTWHGHAFSPREIGYVFGYVGFLGIVLQGGFIGKLVSRFGEPALVKAGLLSLIIGLSIANSIPLLLLVATVSSFGNGVLRPALTSLITQNAGRHEQGVVLGLNQSLMSVAAIFAPVLAGSLIGHMYLAQWAWMAAIAAGGGLLIASTARAGAAPHHGSHRPPGPEVAAIAPMQAPSTGNS